MANLHANPHPNRHNELEQMLHALKLPSFADAFSALALKATKESLSHEAFLYELARLECEQRNQRRIERHLHQSKLPREKILESFQVERLSPTLRLQLEQLKSGQFVEEASNVIVVGPPGVGKTHTIHYPY
ncbi:MAG TPA: ATP-binding protein [Chloroflexia bacterium]|nr:ATP-binding protein [Chloroflexia bacterium]